MKVFNYSDQPIYIKTVPIDDVEVYIPPYFERWIVKHNGQDFLPPSSSDRNVILTIRNTGQPDSYVYRTEEFLTPNIYPWVGLFITFFGFWFMIKIIQKIKTR